MDLEQIRDLLKLVTESGVSEVEVEEGNFKLVIRKHAPVVTMQPAAMTPPYGYPYPPPPAYPAPPPVAANGAPTPPPVSVPAPAPAETPAEPVQTGTVVHAPIVGTFYESPSPDAAPYVQVGDAVKPGDVLCIIEAMKLMNEIECEMAGTITEIMAKNGQPVEYDQPLFVIDPK